MYALEHYLEAPPTVEVLRLMVQQKLRMLGSSRSENCPIPFQQQQPAPTYQQNQVPVTPPPAPNIPQPPQQPVTYRPQPQKSFFNRGDPSHLVINCSKTA